jgi:polyketide cyclase/dehydrase/lipid transport protein
MSSIRKEISTMARPEDAWDAIRDVGALHTRLVPGFVVDTQLTAGERIVKFANGMTVREPIVAIDEQHRRLVWSAVNDRLSHYNASAQVFENRDGFANVVWTADFLPHEAAPFIDDMMEQGAAAMKAALDRLGV